MSQITAPKVHWTSVGYNVGVAGKEAETVLTKEAKVNAWIMTGYRRGQRRLKKLKKTTLGTSVPMNLSDAKEMVMEDPVLKIAAAFNGENKLYLYRQWTSTENGENGKAILYSNSYMKSHAYLRFLVNEARRVTPDLDEAKVEHHIINNSTHKGMMTCEWPCPKQPPGYTKIDSLPTAY